MGREAARGFAAARGAQQRASDSAGRGAPVGCATSYRKRSLRVLADYRATLAEDRRVVLDRSRFVDTAIKVVGVEKALPYSVWLV